ncbi:hypothetical protein YC2023_048953 [Brassica napus]
MKSGRGPGNIGNKLRIYGSDDSCDYHSSVMESTQRQVLLSIYSMAMPISLFRSPWWSRRFLRRYGYWNRRRCRCQVIDKTHVLLMIMFMKLNRNVVVMCVACHMPLRDMCLAL